MLYNGRLTPTNHWPPLIRYPSYYPDRRLSSLWFLGLAIVALVLSIVALIIVFSVEHSWFEDSFNGTRTITQYGLWRVCFFGNTTCDSWFATSGPLSVLISNRLNESRAGINAWQALEIIFLFLTTATFVIAFASIACYRNRHSFHYYLAVLAAFCVWPAAIVGVCTLFVFGFAVFNVASSTRELDWCFYVNLVAVILAILAAILLSIYDALLKKPIKTVEDDTIVETFADLNGNPAALSPSTFVIVRQNKKKRNKPYEYPQILYPNHYFPSNTAPISNGTVTTEVTRTNYPTNANQQMSVPYTSITSVQETTTNNQQVPPPPPKPPIQNLTPYRNFNSNQSNLVTTQSITAINPQTSSFPPIQTQPYRPTLSAYSYQPRSSPTHWHRTDSNALNRSFGYASEPTHDYIQREYYHSNRAHLIEPTFGQKREPRVLHYYTGYDYFATIDPSDVIATRHHGPLITVPTNPIRYEQNPPYHRSSDYITSTM